MLLIYDRLSKIRFGQLMQVYAEGVAANGREFYPELPENQQILRAEQDFYAYLQTGFFTQSGDLYCIWEENGAYVSALRLQRYQDGLLLEALETHPNHRRRGYACRLIQAVLDKLQPPKLYSHIGHRNFASQATHMKCGFQKISDHARYADGSVNTYCGTYLYESKNAG